MEHQQHSVCQEQSAAHLFAAVVAAAPFRIEVLQQMLISEEEEAFYEKCRVMRLPRSETILMKTMSTLRCYTKGAGATDCEACKQVVPMC